MSQRPTPLIIEDIVRSDVHSECITKIYPDLPRSYDWTQHKYFVQLRQDFLNKQDLIAYNKIKEKFPEFKPPSQN
jgi:hypothetical protein